MKHLMGKKNSGETLEEERAALSSDILHLQTQCARFGKEDDSFEAGGVYGLMLREKRRLFDILHDMN